MGDKRYGLGSLVLFLGLLLLCLAYFWPEVTIVAISIGAISVLIIGGIGLGTTFVLHLINKQHQLPSLNPERLFGSPQDKTDPAEVDTGLKPGAKINGTENWSSPARN